MRCPVCGVEYDDDDNEGYHASDICPLCAHAGWIDTADGSVVNERDEDYAINGQDVRR